jgi:hypothetical protein
MARYCSAHQAINAAMSSGGARSRRVLLFSWYRMWLLPELVATANSTDEIAKIDLADDPWRCINDHGFGYVLLDNTFPQAKRLMEHLPRPGTLRELYRDSVLVAYEIVK